jgi:PAS domain S-box-containing protein
MDKPQVLIVDDESIKQGVVYDREIRLLRFDKSMYWALMSLSVVDFEGEPSIMVSINDITERKAAEDALVKEQVKLQERVKEKTCLSEVMRLTADRELDPTVMAMRILDVVRDGWMHLEIARVRIDSGGRIFQHEDFRETPWTQTAVRMTSSGRKIALTVAYLEERPPADEGPFLREERALLEDIVTRFLEVVEQRMAETADREREELINLMFERTTDGIALFDIGTGGFIKTNHAAAASLGYTEDEFVTLKVEDIQTEHSRAIIEANIHSVMAGNIVSFETRHRAKDGGFRDQFVTLEKMKFQRRDMVCVVWRDITEQKQREKEQQDRMDRLQLYARVIREITDLESGIEGDIDLFIREMDDIVIENLLVDRISVWRVDSDLTELQCVDLVSRGDRGHRSGERFAIEEMPDIIRSMKGERYLASNGVLNDM